jgi:predicted amidohydrolase
MMTMRVAVQQTAPLIGDVTGNLRAIEQAAMQAAAAGAALLVCPEMSLSGYHIGAAAVQRLAEAADGAMAVAVAGIAQRAGIAIVYGYPERAADGAVFNAAQCIAADGRRLANHRKTHLFGALDRGMFSAAAELSPVFELNGWRIGLLICYEVEFPENTRRLALAGADLIVVPTANMREFDFVAMTVVPARAYENQCYIAYANHCGNESDIEYGGLSSIVGPDGAFLALAERDEAMPVAVLDRARLSASRERLPYLADRRPALYEAASAGMTIAASASKSSPTGSSR